MLAIYKKELKSYFTSMIGYVVLAIFLLIIGIYFSVYNLVFQSANFEVVLGSSDFLLVLAIAFLTMRLIAEEKKQKTDQLLYTAPVTATSIVMGKFLAVCTMLGIVMLVTCCYPIIMSFFGEVSLRTAYSAIIGFFIMGMAYIAIGLFLSSLTESQLVAALITLATFILTILIDSLAGLLPTDATSAWLIFCVMVLLVCVVLHIMMHNLLITAGFGLIGVGALTAVYFVNPAFYNGAVQKAFNWVSVMARFNDFIKGIFDVANIVYFISIMFIFLFLTTQSIKKKRWS